MSKPLVIAYHLVWTAYGWWLANDPRGSSSHTIRCEVLRELGDLHHGRKRVQPCSAEIRRFYEVAGAWLKHDLLTFDEAARAEVAAAFAEVIARERYTCYACAVMPDHVHLVIRKHKHLAEEMIANLQECSRSRLRDRGRWSEGHPVWGGPGWKVFLDHPDEVRRTIGYVEQNPLKARMPAQRWAFVARYDNWPLHNGHSPNSPYVKALRAAGRYP